MNLILLLVIAVTYATGLVTPSMVKIIRGILHDYHIGFLNKVETIAKISLVGFLFFAGVLFIVLFSSAI